MEWLRWLNDNSGAVTFMVTAVLALITGYYAWEAHNSRVEMSESRRISESELEELRLSRRSAEESLNLLKTQYKSQNVVHVIAQKWSEPLGLVLLNVGPAPALFVHVLAMARYENRLYYLAGSVTGMYPTQIVTVTLQDASAALLKGHSQPSNDEILVLITGVNMLGEVMSENGELLPRAF